MNHLIILTNENFEQEVLKSELPILVDFWAEWCGPCRMLLPIIEEAAEKFAGKLKVAKFDVNNPAHSDLSEKYEIQGIPALKVFKHGQIVKELTGFCPFDELEKELSEYLQ
jgi:thioredoxin 1